MDNPNVLCFTKYQFYQDYEYKERAKSIIFLVKSYHHPILRALFACVRNILLPKLKSNNIQQKCQCYHQGTKGNKICSTFYPCHVHWALTLLSVLTQWNTSSNMIYTHQIWKVTGEGFRRNVSRDLSRWIRRRVMGAVNMNNTILNTILVVRCAICRNVVGKYEPFQSTDISRSLMWFHVFLRLNVATKCSCLSMDHVYNSMR